MSTCSLAAQNPNSLEGMASRFSTTMCYVWTSDFISLDVKKCDSQEGAGGGLHQLWEIFHDKSGVGGARFQGSSASPCLPRCDWLVYLM